MEADFLELAAIVAFAVASRGGPGADPRRAADAEDVSAAARGDQAALGRLYDRYSRLVFGLALRITEDRGSAEEVTQDVFLQFWRRAADFDPQRGDLRSWLLTITRNRAIDRLRSRQQRSSQAWVPLDDTALLRSEPIPYSLDTAERIAKVLAALPEPQRRVIEMAYYQGFTQSEIAARLNQPLGTVKTWTRSALKTLRESLKGTQQGNE